jgi:chemotaxis signal transduction protein
MVDDVELLAVRAGGTAYAIRLTAVSGLFADRTVTPLPGPVPELLGVAAFRGAVVAVYDLGALLGHAVGAGRSGVGGGQTRQSGTVTAQPRWLVLDTGTPPVGLAFDELDGHVRAPARAIATAADGGFAAVHEGDLVRPVIDVPEIRASIEEKCRRR